MPSPIEPFTADSLLMPSTPGAATTPNFATNLALFGVIGKIVHIGPVEREGGVAILEYVPHIFFKEFLGVRVGQAGLVAVDHIVEGFKTATLGEGWLAIP